MKRNHREQVFLPEIIKEEWYQRVNKIFETATLPKISSEKKPMQILSGKKGVHSEHLGILLAEMQIPAESLSWQQMVGGKYGSMGVWECEMS